MEATKTLGKYTLVRHLATGGMAEIWLAEQAGPGGFAKELVIKQILPHLAKDDNFTRMFLDEARLAAQLTHPKIGQIYELGQIGDQYFIAMEFIDGVDLADLIVLAENKNQKIPLNLCAKIVMDLLEALDYAHDFTSRDGMPLNLVHRDVTPHNVIVSNDGIVKLVDFGVAKAKANRAKTQTGAVKGKFAYMAPEQIQNSELDRRVDIFAAGVVFFELITGVKPFGDELAAISSIMSEFVPQPRDHRADVPDELAAVLARAMAKSAADRYQDAHDMLRDIEAWLRAEGSYVGDRELSGWIRDLQGLPTSRPTGAVSNSSPRTPSMEAGSTGTPMPGPISTPAPGAHTPVGGTDASQLTSKGSSSRQGTQVEEAPVASGKSGVVAAEEPAETTSSSSNAGLVVLFFLLVLTAVGIGGAVFYFVVITGEPDEVVVEKPVEVEEKGSAKSGIPKGFRHPDGKLVFLLSRGERLVVYFEGQRVGTTPVETSLRPGTYTIELESEKAKGKRKEHEFEVDDEGFQTTIRLKM